MQLVLLKVHLIILLCDRRTKQRFLKIKVIPNEECVPKHKLLIMDMQFNATKKNGIRSWNQVWKLKEEKTCEEYQSMVKDKVEEAEWKYLDVNEHWQQMKNIMMDTAQVTCGLSKGPCKHKETWW